MQEAGALERRARAATYSFAVLATTDLALIPSNLLYASYLGTLAPEVPVAELELSASELLVGLLGVAYMLGFVMTAIFFLRWFYLAHASLGAMGVSSDYTSPWAVWGFVVPFLNLVYPYRMMREIWDRTYLKWIDEPERVGEREPPEDRIGLWWTLFIVSGIGSRIANRLSLEAVTAAETLTITRLSVLATLLDLAAIAAAVLVIRGVTALELPLLETRRIAVRPPPLWSPP